MCCGCAPRKKCKIMPRQRCSACYAISVASFSILISKPCAVVTRSLAPSLPPSPGTTALHHSICTTCRARPPPWPPKSILLWMQATRRMLMTMCPSSCRASLPHPKVLPPWRRCSPIILISIARCHHRRPCILRRTSRASKWVILLLSPHLVSAQR